ncbi:MAG: hypothetical protein KTR32_21115 [Granulosicoccus sp.]|nr:hypothetical protein [Granulosicoccus sp.]
MFRVLSDDEAKKVVRWKAPDIRSGATAVADTRQMAMPRKTPADTPITQLLKRPDQNNPARSAEAVAANATPSIAVDDTGYRLQAFSEHRQQDGGARKGTTPDLSPATKLPNYDDGYARGYADGVATQKEQSLTQLKSLADSLKTRVSDFRDDQLEQELVALSLKVAGLVLRREIAIDENALLQLVRLGMEQLPALNDESRLIYLHPQDAALLRQQLGANGHIEVIDDATIDRGQCRIEAGASVVRAGIDDWLYAMAGKLGLAETADIEQPERVA